MEKTFDTKFGQILLRNAMIESENGTDLNDGIEIKLDDELVGEVINFNFDFMDEDTSMEDVEYFVQHFVSDIYEI